MADVAHLLETMRAMREPPAPTPIVPVLAMMGGGAVVAAVALFVIWQIRRRRAALKASALAALDAARSLGPADRLAAQARLLRRLVRTTVSDAAARVEGEAWLAALDRVFATRFFTQGTGIVFGDALYRRPDVIDVEALDESLRGLIANLRSTKGLARPTLPVAADAKAPAR